jgi:hypothetical protein
MAKAGAPKKAKPKPKLTDKEQSERFIETARKLRVDESGKEFEKVFESISKPGVIPRQNRSQKNIDD